MKSKLFAIGAILATMSMGVIATEVTPVNDEVEIINEVMDLAEPTLSFEETVLNGEASTVIMKNDEVYLSLSDLVEILGLSIMYTEEGMNIAMTHEAVAPLPLVSMPVNLPEGTEIIERAVIKAIDTEMNQMTILPAGLDDEVTNYLVLNISEETNFTSGLGVMGDFIEGMLVNVAHSPMMTHSMIPQTAALVINPVLECEPIEFDPSYIVPDPIAYEYDADGNLIEQAFIMENVEIIEVSTDDEGNVVSITIGNADDYMSQTIFNINAEETVIKHHMNRMAYRPESLEVGQIVSITYGPMMTMSLPPQTPALEIVLMGESN